VDFVAIAQRIERRLAELDAPVALVGALAFSAYGHSRSTADLDLLTLRRVQAELVSFLEAEGYETLHVSSGYSNHVHREAAKGRVDVVYVDAATAEKVFSGAEVRCALGGVALLVPTAEHLIAMKVRAMKNDPRRQLQDMADIQALLRSTTVDRDAVRRYFVDLELQHLYDQIAATL
jgi:hypothetical protein